jgi:hypothetical protein
LTFKIIEFIFTILFLVLLTSLIPDFYEKINIKILENNTYLKVEFIIRIFH